MTTSQSNVVLNDIPFNVSFTIDYNNGYIFIISISNPPSNDNLVSIISINELYKIEDIIKEQLDIPN